MTPFWPKLADNSYRGSKVALWIFGLLVLVKVAINLGSIFNGHEAAGSADGIPLDSFTPSGAQTVISLFALLGLTDLTFCLVCIIVLARYRALVPLLLALLLAEHVARKLILHYLPVPRTGAPPGFAINLVILALLVIGLALSLRSRGHDPTGASEGT